MKFFKSLLVMSMLAISIPTAYAAECQYGTMNDALARVLGSAGDAVGTEVPESQVKVLIEKKGPPPNSEEGKPLQFIRADSASVEMTILIVGQEGCLINMIGPVPTQMIDSLLGVSNASGG